MHNIMYRMCVCMYVCLYLAQLAEVRNISQARAKRAFILAHVGRTCVPLDPSLYNGCQQPSHLVALCKNIHCKCPQLSRFLLQPTLYPSALLASLCVPVKLGRTSSGAFRKYTCHVIRARGVQCAYVALMCSVKCLPYMGQVRTLFRRLLDVGP